MALDNNRLRNYILGESKELEMAQKLQDVIAEISSSAHKPWWEPEERYYGSCDLKTAEALFTKATVIYQWGLDQLLGI